MFVCLFVFSEYYPTSSFLTNWTHFVVTHPTLWPRLVTKKHAPCDLVHQFSSNTQADFDVRFQKDSACNKNQCNLWFSHTITPCHILFYSIFRLNCILCCIFILMLKRERKMRDKRTAITQILSAHQMSVRRDHDLYTLSVLLSAC